MLPEDGDLANKDILSLFDDPKLIKVYIKAYALNWDKLLEKIKHIDSKGVVVNILADYVQARGRGSWDELVTLNKNLKNGQILLTTSGCGSKSTGQIWHSKAMTFIFSDKDPINLDGSCNFSNSGFLQGNTIRIFTSKIYSDSFIEHFNIHKEWVLQNAQHKQIDYLLEHPINTESIDFDENTSELFYHMEQLQLQNKNYKLILNFLAILVIVQWIIIIIPTAK